MVRMERHKCKLCSRSFSSGRALGGHMRSHLANLPLPPKTPQKQEDTQPPLVSTSSDCCSEEEKEMNSTSSTNEDEKGAGYGLRKNPKKSIRLAVADPPQSVDDAGAVVVVQDGESEAESTKKPTRKRSKRTRRMPVRKQQPSSTESMVELEQVSSVCNTNSPEEDLAMCLMMLSRDVWSTTTSTTSDEYGSQRELKLSNKVMMMSDKSCKKIKINCWGDNCEEEGGLEEFPRNVDCSSSRIKNMVDRKVHECPFCGKVFGSGQALGGHKRSHFLGSTTTATTTTTTTTAASVSNSSKLAAAETESLLVPSSSNSAKFQHEGLFMIDLNLPAPMEEEEADHHHHRHVNERKNEDLFNIQEVSTVS